MRQALQLLPKNKSFTLISTSQRRTASLGELSTIKIAQFYEKWVKQQKNTEKQKNHN